jgi:hypothetical protein
MAENNLEASEIFMSAGMRARMSHFEQGTKQNVEQIDGPDFHVFLHAFSDILCTLGKISVMDVHST